MAVHSGREIALNNDERMVILMYTYTCTEIVIVIQQELCKDDNISQTSATLRLFLRLPGRSQ